MDIEKDTFSPSTKRRRCCPQDDHNDGNGGNTREDAPSGPLDARACAHWAQADVQALKHQGLEHFRIDFSETLKTALDAGVQLRTDYSGIGGVEESFRHVLQASSDFSGSSMATSSVQRAGDVLPDSRFLLRHHKGPCAPKCIHGDILKRMETRTLTRLQRLQGNYIKQAEKAIKKGAVAKEAYTDFGRTFMRKAFKIAKDTAPPPRLLVSDCTVHGRECPVLPAVPKSFKGLLGNAAGVTCIDWSKLGKKQKWLGPSAFPFLQWAVERTKSVEDFVIVECVPNFDGELMAELFDGTFKQDDLLVSPRSQGDPVDRKRKYMILTRPKKLTWHSSVAEMGMQAAFDILFGRRVMIVGDDRLRAPEEAVNEHVAELAVARGFPPTRASGRPWSYYQVLSPSLQRCVKEHENYLVEVLGESKSAQFISNLNQSPGYDGPVDKIMPTLLKSSILWSFRKRRGALPLEHFEAQGYVIYEDGDDKFKCEFIDGLSQLSGSKLRRFAGNGMHLRSVGTVFLFVLACTRRR